jgi:hypothetical protein
MVGSCDKEEEVHDDDDIDVDDDDGDISRQCCKNIKCHLSRVHSYQAISSVVLLVG